MNTKVQKRWLWWAMILLVVSVIFLAEPSQPVTAQQSISGTTYAAYQEFEHGFMVWREDTGEIIAFVEFPNVIFRFPESTYDHLPENPILEESPSGLVKPIRGFGRVWGHFPHVRSQLGWGTISEFGYTATAAIGLGYPSWERISLPNGSTMEYFPDNYWYQWPGSPPVEPPPVTYFTAATVQEFAYGKMLYATDSGTIWVLTDSGAAFTFRSLEYGYLPENPVWGAPPPGYLKPILGFGKVWGNFPAIKNALGWATTNERGYTMQLSSSLDYSWVTMQLPDGQWVDITTTGSWQYH